eukprot:NODE_6491_length_625_cov_3.602431_g5535_i0.p4 GENE.NODE_6491_length_625_cov_3.602431_g5535_i0~~NODE_6491_length_625_cov_3.602431_g5535_i0.p4  ORF type:complete len:53 (+),score=1.91 NODE_6491_length_625_cov_3.602431_g5535_i0:48-206(+)
METGMLQRAVSSRGHDGVTRTNSRNTTGKSLGHTHTQRAGRTQHSMFAAVVF